MKDYIFNVHDVVLLMTAAECLLLAVFQQVLPVRERNYGLLLTAFLLIVATASTCTLILWNSQIKVAPLLGQQLLPYFLFTALMLKGPAFYLYVSALTQQNLRLKPQHALHLVPALLLLLCVAVFDLDSDDLRRTSIDNPDFPKLAVDIVWDLSTLVPLAYAVAAVFLLYRYRSELENEYSNFFSSELNWLNVLTYGVLFSWSWTLLVHILAKYTSVETADLLGIADNYVTFILVNAFFAYSLSYAHKLLATQPQQNLSPSEEKPSESAIAKVQQVMEKEKLYLKKNLNLEQLSNFVGLSPKEVSSVINKHFGTNFFEFINSYRVEEAKALLSDPEKADMTILDVLMESGFNSKSAFHRFFSRLVGMSPTEYRKKALQKNETAVL